MKKNVCKIISKLSKVRVKEELEVKVDVSVDPSDGGVAKGGGEKIKIGQKFILFAEPNEGYEFIGWSDGNFNEIRTVIAEEDSKYIAYFNRIKYCSITVNSHEGGNVNGSCKKIKIGTKQVIKAVANEGYEFFMWDDGNNEPERTVTVDCDVIYTAYFRKLYEITVVSNGGGTATGSKKNLRKDDRLEITAVADAGYEFEYWDDGNKEIKREIVVNRDFTYVAHFKKSNKDVLG